VHLGDQHEGSGAYHGAELRYGVVFRQARGQRNGVFWTEATSQRHHPDDKHLLGVGFQHSEKWLETVRGSATSQIRDSEAVCHEAKRAGCTDAGTAGDSEALRAA